jgi:transposase
MRKSFDALSGLVRNELEREPTCGDVFVFINKPRNSIKLLHWESGGFVLYYKRLEKGTFTPPKSEGKNRPITWPEQVLMIEGIQVKKSVQKPRFRL